MLFGGSKSGGKSPFPGYELKTGTLFSGGFQTFTWDKNRIIPLIIHINCSGGGNYYTARRAYFNLNNISKTILYLEDIDPGSCRGSTESDICTLTFATFDQMKNIGSCSFTQGGGGNGFSLTATCTLWLEKKSGGGALKCSKNPFVKGIFVFFTHSETRQKRGAEHAFRR